MALGERAARLGADARLARRVCGARARAEAAARRSVRRAPLSAPFASLAYALPRPAAPRGPSPRTHQDTNTYEAGSIGAPYAPGRTSARRSTADTGTSCRSPPRPSAPHRTHHAGDYRHRT